MGIKSRMSRGSVAIEFAILSPLLILLLFGIIEFSVFLYDQQVITNASREGARAGITWGVDPVTGNEKRLSCAEVTDVVETYCGTHLVSLGGSAAPSTTFPNGCPNAFPDPIAGQPFTVQVSYQYSFLVIPNFIASLAGGINLTATTVMRME